MAKEVDILSYLPPVLYEIKELIEIANIENPVLSSLWEEIESYLNDLFVATASERGIARYEKMLKLNVPATDSLETRRFRVLTRYQEQAPYSFKVLKQTLDSLLGEGRYKLERNVSTKVLTVKIELTAKGMFDSVIFMLERITPQNMILKVELRYNQHSWISRYTHAQLSQFTHEQLRNEVLT